MLRSLEFCLAFGLILISSFGVAHAQTTKGQQVVEGLEVTSEELERLQQGEVINYTGEDWEQTDRELAADAVVLIKKPLSVVLAETLDGTTLVPRNKILDSGDLSGDGDFSGVDLDVTIDRDIKEAKQLLHAKAGKKIESKLGRNCRASEAGRQH